MAQKLISLEEAADQLGISKERLLELREAGKVPGYRDGASWKFRSEDIDKLAAEGVPEIDPGASDLSLDLDDAGGSSIELPSADEPSGQDLAAADDDDLGLAAEGSELSLESGGSELNLESDEISASPPSDLSLDDVDEPTVEGLDDEGSDALALDDVESIDLNKDSILLSEAELGAMSARPPSTIIGKAELDLDADLDLSPLDKGAAKRCKAGSGFRPANKPAATMNLRSTCRAVPATFEGLDELEVDLEAESSRILSPEDVAKAQSAAKAAQSSKSSGLSDLGLAPPTVHRAALYRISTLAVALLATLAFPACRRLELDDDDEGPRRRAATSRSPARAAASTLFRRRTADSRSTKCRST